jgi:hypothetical protein
MDLQAMIAEKQKLLGWAEERVADLKQELEALYLLAVNKELTKEE